MENIDITRIKQHPYLAAYDGQVYVADGVGKPHGGIAQKALFSRP